MHRPGQGLRSRGQGYSLTFLVTHPTMKPTHHARTHEPTEREIQHAAYLMWIEDGRPAGRDLEHWFAAKEMLSHRHGRDSSTRRPAPEIAAPLTVALNEK